MVQGPFACYTYFPSFFFLQKHHQVGREWSVGKHDQRRSEFATDAFMRNVQPGTDKKFFFLLYISVSLSL